MIDLTHIKIHSPDNVISARNKVNLLLSNVGVPNQERTYLATYVSMVLKNILKDKAQFEIILSFSKNKGYYFFHVLIPCDEIHLKQYLVENNFFEFNKYVDDSGNLFLNLYVRIPDKDFVPNQDFIEDQKEQLIQGSKSEMLIEIKQKNAELTKALEDIKNSSRLIQSEKMRSLGLLTAGVAHELNNPMMGILNFVQYAIKHTDEDDRRYRPLMDAEREVRRCQDIVSNLLTFSRMKAEGEEKPTQVKASVLIERTLKLQAYKLRAQNVSVIKQYCENEPILFIKVNKVQQVILNLVTNAIDAMKESEKKELLIIISHNQYYNDISIKDSGTGMDEETQDKIFEPFFTTKQTGQGTGLGLAVSQSIIEQHNGQLLCESEVGSGTQFTIRFPNNINENDEDII